MKLALLLLLLSSPLAALNPLLEQQIEEDLERVKPFSSDKIEEAFESLPSDQPCLLCKIRRGQISWKSASTKDHSRVQKVKTFLYKLAIHRPLPDLDCIIFLGDGFHQNSPVPLLAFAANQKSKENICLMPDVEALHDGSSLEERCRLGAALFPWNLKIDRAFFRGVSTGGVDPTDELFLGNSRLRAVAFSYFHPDLLEADFNKVFQKEIMEVLNALGKSIQPRLPIEDHLYYKYLLDIDGNSCTYSRCRWILLSNSVLLKVGSDLVQWYYKALLPYENYVPIDADLGNLAETIGWLRGHDEEAKSIAMEGQKMALSLFSEKELSDYLYTLLVGLAKKQIHCLK